MSSSGYPYVPGQPNYQSGGSYPSGPNQSGTYQQPQYNVPPSYQQQQQQQQPPYFQQPGYAPPQPYPGSNTGGQGDPSSQVAAKQPWDPNQATSYTGPDIASDDLDENHQGQDEIPSAPSYDLVVSGYENVLSGSDASVGPPPPYESIEVTAAMVDSSNIPAIDDEEARNALLAHVAEQACWGSGAAKKMIMRDMTPTCAFHYKLETFTEGRSTKYTYEPFKGGYIDGPCNGPAPMPWDIPCNSTALFKSEVHKVPVPHTDVIKVCHGCHGRGFNRCQRCWGRGRVRCSSCSGLGHRTNRDAHGNQRRTICSMCHGHGRRTCLTCRGLGSVTCRHCAGYRNIKQFIQLTVTFANRVGDHIVERTDLPDELIRGVQGTEIFEQTLPRVAAIQNFYEQEINRKSLEIVQAHAQSWPAERVLQQRHVLRAVPVHECHFEHGGKMGRFWVYGHQHKVYTQDYPHTCCCCSCSIL